ncbi:MAG: hypothetical protein BGO55_11065 [Sphingobacteriales bacterium 50-39]|nr:DUF692 domain-containing protein [Sphingobacteriales bacterium]OJW54242.1 MAG: hypothetical protein BGO55_11065 [Sphingobacteriales bacterium 50-39]
MVGIGFRKDFADQFLNSTTLHPDFIEVSPENWIGVGGYWKKMLYKALDKYPLFTHGLSLSLGSPDELDLPFLKKTKQFLKDTGARLFSEHLSYAKCDNAHLYDLLPMPFTEEAIRHVSQRIRQVQDVLGDRIAIEIVSYYTPVAPEMDEIEFVNGVLELADCRLLLDVNNVYVNSFNHHYDAKAFIDALPLDRIRYIHMAGHEQVEEDLILDTHGQPIANPVYDLFGHVMSKLNDEVPVLLERDFNIPELSELQQELDRLASIKAIKRNTYAIAG